MKKACPLLILLSFMLILIAYSKTTYAYTVFTDRVAWENAITGSIITEDFNSIALGTTYISPSALPSGPTITPNGSLVDISNFAFSAIGEGKGLRIVPEALGVDLDFIGLNVFAFGFDYADVDITGVTASLGAFSDTLPMTGNADIGVTPDDFAFYGIISSIPAEIPISLSFNFLSDEGLIIDNLSFVSAVPEPSAVILIVSGLFGFAFFRKKFGK